MSNLGLKQQVELQYQCFKELKKEEPMSCLVKAKMVDGSVKLQSIQIKKSYKDVENPTEKGVLCYVDDYACIKVLCEDISMKIHGFKLIQILYFC